MSDLPTDPGFLPTASRRPSVVGAEASADPPTDAMLGTVLQGKYRLERVLARGGSGRVYAARQLPIDRTVAVKVLRLDLDEESEERFEERFFREASMAGQLQHPHVVTVHDYGRTPEGICFIVMELLEGRSLKDRMKDGPMAPAEALPIFEQIVRGLRHAHRAGLVHRDMKPGNVQLVPGEDGQPFAKILDFGLVHGEGDSEITREGYFVGTPHYAAPEQVQGGDVDARTDLYAVGIMLYRALCGRLPYWSKQGMAIAMSQVHDPYPPMSERAPGVAVPPSLEDIVRRCMEKEPARRYDDATALLAALRAAHRFVSPGRLDSAEVSISDTLPNLDGDEHLDLDPETPPTRPFAPVTVPKERRRSRRAVLLLLPLLLVAGLGWLLLRPAPPDAARAPAVAEPPAAASVAVLAEAPAAPEPLPPRALRVLISSEPPGAQVLLDGAVLGVTPLADQITVQAEGPETRTFTLRKDGYQSGTLELDVTGEQATGTVTLEARPVAAPAAAAPAPDPSPPRATAPEEPAAAPAAPTAPAASAPPSLREAAGRGAGAVVADGVRFSAAEAAAALAFLNSADKAALLKAGVAPRQANIVLDKRPFASVAAFAATPYIGEKTVQAVRRAAQ